MRTNLLLFVVYFAITTNAWIPAQTRSNTKNTCCLQAAVGIFFGTSTGSTQECADKLYDAFGDDVAAEPVDVDTLEAGNLAAIFGEHDALVVGTPTWNTGADTERSGTGWDDLYYDKLPSLKAVLAKKKVAVFGLGDQISYAENYADAAGELYDVFTDLGCDMVPYAATSQDGYEHEDSKSIRGDLFCGLLLDQVNQDDLSDERVEAWVAQLKAGGFMSGGGTSSAGVSDSPPIEDAIADVEPVSLVSAPAEQALVTLNEGSTVLNENIGLHSSGGFTPHFNPVTKKTMWTSSDGRRSYVTSIEMATKLSP